MDITKSLIIPCKEEGEEFLNILSSFIDNIKSDTELIVVFDDKDDSTYKILKNSKIKTRIVINDLGPGPTKAIKSGIKASVGKNICIAMGDGSDDPTQVEDLLFLLERGCSVAVASRYSRGGQFVGEKDLKYLLSKYSGKVLNFLFFIGTKDPTNMFKAYSKSFLNEVEIESENGFTLGLEMIIKAKLHKKKIGEIPTIWIDREFGESKFNMKKYLPSYLYWVYRLIFRKK